MQLTTFGELTICPALFPADDRNPFICPANSSTITFKFDSEKNCTALTLTEYTLLNAFMEERASQGICLGNLRVERSEDSYVFHFDDNTFSIGSVELRAALTECNEFIAAFRREFFDLKLAYKIADMKNRLEINHEKTANAEKAAVPPAKEAKESEPIASQEAFVKRKLYIRQIDQLKSADFKLTCVNKANEEYVVYAKAKDTEKIEKWEPFFKIYKKNKENGNLTTLNCDTITTDGGYIVIKNI